MSLGIDLGVNLNSILELERQRSAEILKKKEEMKPVIEDKELQDEIEEAESQRQTYLKSLKEIDPSLPESFLKWADLMKYTVKLDEMVTLFRAAKLDESIWKRVYTDAAKITAVCNEELKEKAKQAHKDHQNIFIDKNAENVEYKKLAIDNEEDLQLCVTTKVVIVLICLFSNDPTWQLKGCTVLRMLLSLNKNPPIKPVVSMKNIVARLYDFVDQSRDDVNHSLQFEALWCITNLLSGESTEAKALIEFDVISVLGKALKSTNNPKVLYQCIWALGNLCGEGPKVRDRVIQTCPYLIDILCAKIADRKDVDNTNRRVCGWVASNLARKMSDIAGEQLLRALPALAEVIKVEEDLETLTEVMWAVAYMSDGASDTFIESTLQSGVLNRVALLLVHENDQLRSTALRIAGNMLTGTDSQTERTIRLPKFMTNLKKLITDPEANIRKEVMWSLSNITAGSKGQIAIVREMEFLPLVLNALYVEKGPICNEASWVVENMANGGTEEDLKYLVNEGALHALLSAGCREPICAVTAIGGVYAIVNRKSDAANDFRFLLLHGDNKKALEELQKAQNDTDILDQIMQVMELLDDAQPLKIESITWEERRERLIKKSLELDNNRIEQNLNEENKKNNEKILPINQNDNNNNIDNNAIIDIQLQNNRAFDLLNEKIKFEIENFDEMNM